MSLAGLTNTSLAVVRDQELSVHEQLDIVRHFGLLHKHATTLVPREPGLTVIIYSDTAQYPGASAFSKIEFWYSDVMYEIQPPSITSLKVMTGPEYGGDTLWSSGHTSRVSQHGRASGGISRGRPPRPKSVYVYPGFTHRIPGVPIPESKTTLNFLFHQVAEDVDFQVRFHWEPNSIVFWDKTIVTHTATFNFWPQTSHALRATSHGEKPESIED
ncbi:Clavaminate synthase-like protein [Suillus brevipes Sb2]|nr:Clavaminate synthase-like protein [Suillus brevipes Sb2]